MSTYVERSRYLGTRVALRKFGAYAPTGTEGTGARDAFAGESSHGQRISDSVSRGFSVNENQVDPTTSSDMSEPGTVAQANKIAAAGLPGLPKIPAAGKLPGVPKVKPAPAFDPRTDKPQGYNLTHGVQTVANGADVGNSYSAFSRRLQGSPV